MRPALDPRFVRIMILADPAVAGGVEASIERGRQALEAGATAIQLRDKRGSSDRLVESGRVLRRTTREHGALLIVNDRIEVALVVEADGVHLGPDDVPVEAARRIVPSGFVIGYSTDDPVRAAAAVSEGADYIGCGTVFPTASKTDAGSVIGVEGLRAVVDAVSVPVLGIGGIGPENAAAVMESGCAGVAVLGAVMGSPDAASATAEILAAVDSGSG